MGFYDDKKVAKAMRYFRMNETEQETPMGRFKVVLAEKRLSAAKTEYPVLTLEGEDGQKIETSAWERDVSACILEWGDKEPKDWGFVSFEKKERRFALIPAENQVVIEEPIGV